MALTKSVRPPNGPHVFVFSSEDRRVRFPNGPINAMGDVVVGPDPASVNAAWTFRDLRGNQWLCGLLPVRLQLDRDALFGGKALVLGGTFRGDGAYRGVEVPVGSTVTVTVAFAPVPQARLLVGGVELLRTTVPAAEFPLRLAITGWPGLVMELQLEPGGVVR